MNFIDTKHDRDSSKDVWDKLYSIVYKKSFGDVFCFQSINDSETSSKCKRLYLKINKEKNLDLRNKYPKFKISGDCDFNFNTKKVRLFKRLLKQEDYSLLTQCHNNHHEFCNFSWMPITGGMNNTKECLRCTKDAYAFDRLDVFIHELNLYYKQKNNRILRQYNRNALNWFLNLEEINDVYKYCKEIYLIDNKEFVDKMISSGCQPIINRESAIKYMELAIEYWELRKEKLKSLGVDLSE